MNTTRRTFLKKSGGAAALVASPAILLAHPPAPAKASRRVLRFAVASDGHFGQPDTEYARFFAAVTDSLNAERDRSGLDAAFFNGDLIHDRGEFMPQAKAAFDKLTMPYYVTRGNHDMVSPQEWERIWGYSENHVVELGDTAFLLGSTATPEGKYVCADLRWLKKSLDSQKRKKHVFVLLHISQRKWTTHGIDCPEVISTIESYANVRAIFHGDDDDEDNVKMSGGKPYLYDGHFGGNWGANYRGYRIVEVFEDGRISTYQVNLELNPVVNVRVL